MGVAGVTVGIVFWRSLCAQEPTRRQAVVGWDGEPLGQRTLSQDMFKRWHHFAPCHLIQMPRVPRYEPFAFCRCPAASDLQQPYCQHAVANEGLVHFNLK